jgi:hypothetical protein
MIKVGSIVRIANYLNPPYPEFTPIKDPEKLGTVILARTVESEDPDVKLWQNRFFDVPDVRVDVMWSTGEISEGFFEDELEVVIGHTW